jgi:hypothetical protein
MSLLKEKKSGEAPAAGGAPSEPGSGAPPNPGGHPSADEGQRFQGQNAQRPDFVPEKFWKDGKVDLETAFKSYGELETKFTTKTEELLKQLDADRRKALPESPEKYELKLGDDAPLKAEDIAAHPAVEWWRKAAFEAGLPPDKFNEGVGQIIGILTQGPDLEAEAAKLGENATVRIEAVTQWAQKTFADPEEFEAIQQLGTSAAGIKVLEKMMGKPASGGEDGVPAAPSLTAEKLKEMQADPRYWDRNRREPAFVKQVDEGFEKLYGAKK